MPHEHTPEVLKGTLT